MKKNLLLLALGAASLMACQGPQTNHLRLSGHVADVSEGIIYLQRFEDKMYTTVDSATIVGGEFSFSSDVPLPEIYGLTLDPVHGSPLMLFLDGGDIRVELDPANYYEKTTVTGSALHDEYEAYLESDVQHIDSFILAHPRSLVAAYGLYRHFSYRLTPDEIDADIALLDTSLHHTSYVRIAHQVAEALRATGVGQPAPLFTLDDTEGQPLSLSDYLGKSYLLVDFWASWCGPCRRENPNIVKAYADFHSKGFDIVAISLDKERDAWLTAIEHDGLTWHHVSELKFWDSDVSRAYGVRSIPSNVLLDKDGVIIARNLHGDELHQRLSELYK